jgi:hypothetical protein
MGRRLLRSPTASFKIIHNHAVVWAAIAARLILRGNKLEIGMTRSWRQLIGRENMDEIRAQHAVGVNHPS